jgi:hypothetical protein
VRTSFRAPYSSSVWVVRRGVALHVAQKKPSRDLICVSTVGFLAEHPQVQFDRIHDDDLEPRLQAGVDEPAIEADSLDTEEAARPTHEKFDHRRPLFQRSTEESAFLDDLAVLIKHAHLGNGLVEVDPNEVLRALGHRSAPVVRCRCPNRIIAQVPHLYLPPSRIPRAQGLPARMDADR